MAQYNNLNSVMKTENHFKNRAIFIILLCNIFFVSCQKDNHPMEKIIGKWQLVEGYNLMGGFYSVAPEDQIIEKYMRDNRILNYDDFGNEVYGCNFRINESVLTRYGEDPNGIKWEFSCEYWFSNDTLKIRHDGGFEYYDEYFIRIN